MADLLWTMLLLGFPALLLGREQIGSWQAKASPGLLRGLVIWGWTSLFILACALLAEGTDVSIKKPIQVYLALSFIAWLLSSAALRRRRVAAAPPAPRLWPALSADSRGTSTPDRPLSFMTRLDLEREAQEGAGAGSEQQSGAETVARAKKAELPAFPADGLREPAEQRVVPMFGSPACISPALPPAAGSSLVTAAARHRLLQALRTRCAAAAIGPPVGSQDLLRSVPCVSDTAAERTAAEPQQPAPGFVYQPQLVESRLGRR